MNITVTMKPWEKILGWVLLALHLLFLPLIIELVCFFFSIELSLSVLNIVNFIAAWVITVTIFHRFLWENLKNFRKDIKNSLYAALGGFGLFYVLNIFVNIIIMNLAPDFSNVNDDNIQQLSQGYYWIMTFCTVLLVPLTEEVLYRGMIFGLVWHKNRILGYVVSALVFAAIHMVGYIGTVPAVELVIGFFQYLPACIGLAYAYEKADSIWAPILVHCTVNLIGMLAMR